MSIEKKYYGHIAVSKDEHGFRTGFYASIDLDKARQLALESKGRASAEADKDNPEPSHEAMNEGDESFSKTMRKVVETNHHQSELLFMTPLMSRAHSSFSFENIVKPIESRGNIAHREENLLFMAFLRKCSGAFPHRKRGSIEQNGA